MKFGIHLSGILGRQCADVWDTLRALRALGFRQIEPCISLDPIPGMERAVWPEAWFRLHAPQIHALGLETVCAHICTQNLPQAAQRLKRLSAECGIRTFVVTAPPEPTHENLQQAALAFMRTADVLEEAGAQLLLYGGSAGIASRIGGRTVFEHMLALCLGKVGAQVDVGRAYAAGEDPEALVWRLAPLVKSLHCGPLPGGEADTAAIACFQFARAMGIPQIIHQHQCTGDPIGEAGKYLQTLSRLTQVRERTASCLNTLDVYTGEVRTLRRFDRVIEAPNWMKDSRIVFNADGRIYTYDLQAGTETPLDTGLCDNCNNDHVLSPDERLLAVSHSPKAEPWASRVYILPIEGGAPAPVTPNAPSYLHGWSPDGGELAYCAFREQTGADIYTISVRGGQEVRRTYGGFNDGPEYSPDGRYIWFNSSRTGLMQIWRMNRDGSGQTQMTFTERNNWFAHVSPDGSKVAYLSYRKGDLDADEHLPNMQVELWLMDADGSNPRRVLSFFGGQGSINVNSWAGDSRHLAFVSYELLHK